MRKFHFPKFMQLLILLAVVLFNFGPANTGVAHAVNCYTLTLVNNPVAGGTINAVPAPDCNGGTQYTEGTVVTLTGLPEPGYLFGTWQGASTTIVNPTNVSMTADKSVTAVYMADQWDKAIDVGVPYSITVSTLLASKEPVNEPQVINCNGINIRGGKATIWFKYTAPASGLVSFDTVGSFQSAVNPANGKVDPYDTYISVWTGTIDSEPNDGNPVLVACNDDNDAGYVSQLGFNAVAGTTYYIQVAQFIGNAGTSDDPYYNGGTLNFHVGYGAQVDVTINTTPKGTNTLNDAEAKTLFYNGVADGPVQVISAGVPIFTSEHRNYQTSFSETLGFPDNQLTTKYWFTRYAYNANVKTWILVTNPSGSTANVSLFIGDLVNARESFTLAPGATVSKFYDGVAGGPVVVQSTNGVKIFASEHRNYLTSFSETLGFPDNQLTTKYWFTRYAYNANVKTWILVTNPSGSTANVSLFIGDLVNAKESFTLAPGASVTKFYDGVAGGPVVVQSTNGVNIFASEHRNYLTSFSETLGFPDNQLTTEYHFTRYAYNANVKTWILVVNPSGTTANVSVFIGNQTTAKESFTLAPGASVTKFYDGVAGGPVRVLSTNGVNIFASEHRNYLTSFSETLGYPNNQLTTKYWFTRYAYNANVKTWILLVNP